MSYLAFDLVGKRIELLKEWVPQVRHVAVLARPQHPGEHRERQATQEVIDKLDMLLSYFPTPDLTKMDEVFRAVLEARCDALVVFPDAAMFAVSDQIARFAAQAKLPSVSGWGSFARNGLLLTYGPNVPEIYRFAGALHGPHPAWHQGRRAPRRIANQVRAGHQSRDRQGARPRRAADVARPRKKEKKEGVA